MSGRACQTLRNAKKLCDERIATACDASLPCEKTLNAADWKSTGRSASVKLVSRSIIRLAIVFVVLAAWLTLESVEASIACAATEYAGALAEGTRFATPYFIKESPLPGPTVLVIGGVHGNEIAGPLAVDILRRCTIQRGRLLLIPRANLLAVRAQTRHTPDEDDELSDLNRDFPEVGKNEPPRGVLAEALWRFVQHQKPDWLIDLHESANYRLLNLGSTGNTILMSETPQTQKAANVLLDAINATISDSDKQWGVPRPPKDGSLARAAAEHLHIHALLFETTNKDQPLDVRVQQHVFLVAQLLKYLNMTAH
jgi:predicted deacylase